VRESVARSIRHHLHHQSFPSLPEVILWVDGPVEGDEVAAERFESKVSVSIRRAGASIGAPIEGAWQRLRAEGIGSGRPAEPGEHEGDAEW
jgi:hypothetical protein